MYDALRSTLPGFAKFFAGFRCLVRVLTIFKQALIRHRNWFSSFFGKDFLCFSSPPIRPCDLVLSCAFQSLPYFGNHGFPSRNLAARAILTAFSSPSVIQARHCPEELDGFSGGNGPEGKCPRGRCKPAEGDALLWTSGVEVEATRTNGGLKPPISSIAGAQGRRKPILSCRCARTPA